jgi:hypothetical protein
MHCEMVDVQSRINHGAMARGPRNRRSFFMGFAVSVVKCHPYGLAVTSVQVSDAKGVQWWTTTFTVFELVVYQIIV